ncbi:hypothetical protein [Desulfoscipio gibsoniae]|uniref:Core-binding (CB) domain-containing protein n=1 Tax=Desulfoscipio gibsoniae DSM 7213 TaxID=767817 RepID=R4KG12_9FIRM|nr:hypothetical protein [Desulfoscipio gibsoniae]AGL01514.1 hypothetical protein Desgi_2079 [Desulfoscipio gibsoniae DSM 7213]
MSKKKQKWEVILNDFLFMKQAEGRSETTINDYDFHINLFFARFPSALKTG